MGLGGQLSDLPKAGTDPCSSWAPGPAALPTSSSSLYPALPPPTPPPPPSPPGLGLWAGICTQLCFHLVLCVCVCVVGRRWGGRGGWGKAGYRRQTSAQHVPVALTVGPSPPPPGRGPVGPSGSPAHRQVGEELSSVGRGSGFLPFPTRGLGCGPQELGPHSLQGRSAGPGAASMGWVAGLLRSLVLLLGKWGAVRGVTLLGGSGELGEHLPTRAQSLKHGCVPVLILVDSEHCSCLVHSSCSLHMPPGLGEPGRVMWQEELWAWDPDTSGCDRGGSIAHRANLRPSEHQFLSQ